MVNTGETTYLVTGASRGIGLEMVKQLLARGDVVVAAARKSAKATNLQAMKTDKLHVIELDVENPTTIQACVLACKLFLVVDQSCDPECPPNCAHPSHVTLGTRQAESLVRRGSSSPM